MEQRGSQNMYIRVIGKLLKTLGLLLSHSFFFRDD